MKTQAPSTNRPARRLPEIIKILGLTLTSAALASCGVSSNNNLVSSPLSLSAGNYSKTDGDPLTCFPEGVPAFVPGDFRDGQWVSGEALPQSRGWEEENRNEIDLAVVGFRNTAASWEHDRQRNDDVEFNIRNAYEAGKAGPAGLPFEAERLDTLGSLN